MSSFWMNLRYWLTDYRVLAALGIAAAAAVAYFGVDGLLAAGGWLLVAVLVAAAVWLLVVIARKVRARRAGERIDEMVNRQAEHAVASAQPAARADAEQLRERMAEAVKAIKSSKLGQTRGSAALYELPWYVIIGNPAAGKSTAILNSGLRFPFEDNRSNVIHGLGGTRNCDWYFTTEGIVLDTAGRYSVSAEDRLEWLTFLDLLKKNRPRAPINGIIIAASIAELSGSKPEFAIELAKNLRQRVQELTERLEVHAPVYVVFTKADLISGFTDFFRNLDPSERENAWGATLPYDVSAQTDALAAFDHHFDILSDGLREMGLSQMAMARGREVAPGLLTMPMEFAGIKPALQTFIATLFEENPYQFKPVFRGFYFTSALQEGVAVQPASERVSRQFDLPPGRGGEEAVAPADSSHFLLGLFRKVIFADRQLVRQYSSPGRTRLRYAAFGAAVLALGIALTGWTWSYTGNRQLVADVRADLDKAIALQEGKVDLQSRVEALLVLQDRLGQLERYRDDHPLSLGLGLYQGEAIEATLRREYFHGMRQLMLDPTTTRIEDYLGKVVASAGELRPPRVGAPADGQGDGQADDGADATAGTGQLYRDASPTDTQDAYNALKTYLMLADGSKVEATHLGDQLTRFWRGWLEANRGAMPREDMLRAAGRLMTFYVAQAGHPDWPEVENRYSLVDDSRQALRAVMKGTPARDRVYAQIKARAATRFSPVSVASLLGEDGGDLLTGSHQIPGTFTREAWEEYVEDAIAEAATTELSSTDWVLEATVQNDLTLAGSPQHIAQELTALYKAEYAREWRKLLLGVGLARFEDFADAVARMNRLGDPAASPLRALLEEVNRQTVWDNPAAASAVADAARGGFVAWFNRVIMRRNPTSVAVEVDPGTGAKAPAAAGPIGQEFAGLARLLATHEGNPPLLDQYFEALGKVRTRFNAIKTQGDPGPGTRQLMQQTFDGEGSELAAALRLVDEQMLNGLAQDQRDALRPLLLRPLMQGFSALVPPTEAEINRTWAAQVHKPFAEGIGQRYPYSPNATVEAAPSDIERMFGPQGAIAKFGEDALGSLVIRRGNTLTARQWADIGINLRPELVANYGRWVGASAAGDGPTMVIEILPLAARGREYTVTIDGQQLRYRNTPPQWHTFQLPGQGVPGVRIAAVTGDGRGIDVFNEPGDQAMARMFEAARKQSLGKNHYRLAWERDGAEVEVELRIVSVVQPNSDGNDALGLQLPALVAGATPAVPGGASTATAAPAEAP
ncbi:type VI secretion system membrane subunit TssM [Novilysobacter arseniciresistens]|uniref:type VI secretion system membrane subunit TssM n=1 Tax=Novilysobacter arseniciresistens TaxID=1385522 RepID=UPI0009E046F4|nr:type VI secretion system membrane subunit TssM [Lysobacter arseniciresistens]